jgi:hypothetical protein
MIRDMMVFAITAMTTISAATSAQADELSKWGDSGDWAILVDPDTGNGCLMEKRFDDGTLVQFGTVPNRDGGFFAAYNPDWTDIEDGATGTVKFEFPKIRFVGDVVGVAADGRYGGYAFFDNPNVTQEFARNNDMTIQGELGRVIAVNLKGTMKAIKAVKECQAEQPAQ